MDVGVFPFVRMLESLIVLMFIKIYEIATMAKQRMSIDILVKLNHL